MKLQIALDKVDTSAVVKMVGEICDVIDIVEIGTPMIVHEGINPVKVIKNQFPNLTVLADVKIVDGGEIEANYAFNAGADLVTVLAIAPDDTIRAVVQAAREHGGMCVADMMCSNNLIQRTAALVNLGVDYICLHTGVDEQKSKSAPLEDLNKVKKHVMGVKTSIAGGINFETIHSIVKASPDIIISGSALTTAPNLREAVLKMAAVIRNNKY